MTEKIEIKGTVTAYPDAFDMTNKRIMVITTDGLISLPVSNPRKYKINQKVKIAMAIEKCEEHV